MNKKFAIVLVVLLLFVSGFGFWYWQSLPSRQIVKTLETMAELGSSPPAEPRINQTLAARRLADHFSQQAFIEWPGDELIPAGRWSGRESIMTQVLAAKNSATYKVSVVDLTLTAVRGRRQAETSFSLTVREGGRIWTWLAGAQLIKDGGDWLVDQLFLNPVLRP